METRDKEVLRATHVLRDYCQSKNIVCEGCLLRGNACSDIPQYWDPPELEETEPTERKLVKIKTIVDNVAERDKIDSTVNSLLCNGWTLRKRELIVKPDHVCCDFIYIELERYEHD